MCESRLMRVAIVGHVEWVEFLRVARMPTAGEIVHASEWWEQPGGGGPGAAVQLARLAGDATFFTAVGNDDLGRRARRELTRRGVRFHGAVRNEPTRRAVTHIDASGERTITVIGERLAPHAGDRLPWEELEDMDAVYFTAGDPDALRLARSARVLVATSRITRVIARAEIELDAIVGSALDPDEAYESGSLCPVPRLAVRTAGGNGGTFQVAGGESVPYAAVPLPGPIVDRYGAGDSFAGGLTYALGAGYGVEQAVAFAARCGAAAVTGRGPYGGQLESSTLE